MFNCLFIVANLISYFVLSVCIPEPFLYHKFIVPEMTYKVLSGMLKLYTLTRASCYERIV